MNVFDFIESCAFCMIRPGVALSLLPFGANGPLGKAIRLPLVLVFATLPAHESVPRDLLHAAAAEVFIGLAIGLLLGGVFHVASTAGALLDQQSGYTIASVYDSSFGEEAALMQTLLTQFAALTFFTGDGLKAVIGLFADSWTLWPPGLDHGSARHLFQTFSAEQLASSFAEGLRIAAPLVVLLILVDISFGLMSRHAKRLNPFATARPVKVMVLSLAAASAVPVVFEHLLRIVVAGAHWSSHGEKTEQPTPHRLTRARNDGDVAKSTALTVTVSGALWWLFLLIEAPHLYDELVDMTSRVLQLDMNQSFTTRLDVLLDAVAGPAESALVALGFAMLAVCAPEFAQTRGLIAGKHAAPDFKRINPVEGFKKLFGMKVLFDTGLMLVQFALVALMCWLEIARWLAQTVPAFALTLPSQLALAGRVHTHLLALVCLSQLATQRGGLRDPALPAQTPAAHGQGGAQARVP